MTHSSSFRAMRARVLGLLDAVAGRGAPAGVDTSAVARARAFAAALRTVRPVPPAELSDPEFLARIYERAARSSARAIGPSVLGRAFVRSAAPREVAWVEPHYRPDLGAMLRTGLPGRQLPVAFHRQRPARLRRTTARWTAAAAAMLVAAGAFVALRGTSVPVEPVFVAAGSPLSADHPSDFLRGLVDR